jgi:ABC-type nitrate/sulfonate/bicarbonate transport system substrate-binding protein
MKLKNLNSVASSRRLIAALLALTSIQLLYCVAHSATLNRIRMSYPALSGAVTPLWVAKDMGFFEKQGLDVDLVLIQSGPRSVSTMLSGEMGIINTGANSAIAANLGGAKDVVLIASLFNTLVFSVIGKAEIADVNALRGKTLGVTQTGSLSDFTARLVLSRAGLNPNRDVTLLPTGDYTGMLVSLRKGSIDAGVMSAPTTLQAKKLNFREILDVGGIGIEFAGTSIATTRGFIREAPGTVRAVVAAIVQAIHFMKTDKEGSIKVLARWTKSRDREVLEELYNTYATKHLPRVPSPTLGGVKAVLETLSDRIPKAGTADPKEFIDDRFVRELVDSGFVKNLY